MPAVSESNIQSPKVKVRTLPVCYHCGLDCLTCQIATDNKCFCCEGCRLVYEILDGSGLCDYYKLQSHPGIGQIRAIRSDKYSFLDDEAIANKLYKFANEDLIIVVLYIPSIHCSSCMWLLEHLNRIDPGIIESRISFTAKEVTIHFSRRKTSFRKIAELLTTIGYEPYISLDDTDKNIIKTYNKQRIIKLGVAGFCFGNIMMMSFPEYLSGKAGMENQYANLFRYLNLALSIPVFFYAATEFYSAAWAGLKQKMLNIDAPIVLALGITFSRSIYEIITHTGAGYLDSISGIVFFMLAGRVLQERTYKSLSFTRDYKSYFPIAVNARTREGTVSKQLQDLREKDIVELHHGEIIPADSIVLSNRAMIDYSFVTGEAEPVKVNAGETVYAGGRQTGEELILRVVKPIAGSYLTSLWNNYAFKKDKASSNDERSAVHVLSRYFTVILFSLALLTAVYWYIIDPTKVITSVSAMLIVACPCALLLSATFTNSNILRIFNLNGFYLRDATVIEQLATANHIVFDKTGTITNGSESRISASGYALSAREKDIVYTIARQSNHPNSKAIVGWLGERGAMALDNWEEIAGKGLLASAGGKTIRIGSAEFVGIARSDASEQSNVYIEIDGKLTFLSVQPAVRAEVPGLISTLKTVYSMSLLSGDNDGQRGKMQALFGEECRLLFGQKPEDKLSYIQSLQGVGSRVVMIGDGLNDAGALQQSNVGITLAEDVNNFTPACDAIFDAHKIGLLPSLLELARASTIVVRISFVVSIIYNVAGLYFAMQGTLKPVVAAILMPCSTLSIVILSSGLSNIIAWRKHLSVKSIH